MTEYTQRVNEIYNDYMCLFGNDASPLIKLKTMRDINRHFIQNISNKKVRDALLTHGINSELQKTLRMAIEQETLQGTENYDA